MVSAVGLVVPQGGFGQCGRDQLQQTPEERVSRQGNEDGQVVTIEESLKRGQHGTTSSLLKPKTESLRTKFFGVLSRNMQPSYLKCMCQEVNEKHGAADAEVCQARPGTFLAKKPQVTTIHDLRPSGKT